jgi:hypothetical protein
LNFDMERTARHFSNVRRNKHTVFFRLAELLQIETADVASVPLLDNTFVRSTIDLQFASCWMLVVFFLRVASVVVHIQGRIEPGWDNLTRS